MYYLQATVYEEHGQYHTHCYLWARQQDLPDLLLTEGSCCRPPSSAPLAEHEQIVAVIMDALSGISPMIGVSLPGESLF